MSIARFFQRTALGSALLAATPSPATVEDIPAPETAADVDTANLERIVLYGSERTTEFLRPIGELILTLANTNVVAISRPDVVPPKTNTPDPALGMLLADAPPSDETILERMRAALVPFEHVLPYRLHEPLAEPEPGDERRNKIPDAKLLQWYGFADNNSPYAIWGVDPETLERTCQIIAPDPNSNTHEDFLSMANLPMGTTLQGIDHIAFDDIVAYIMFHEAHHCTQDFTASTDQMDRNIYTLENERDADDVALEVLRYHLGATRDDVYIKDVIDLVHGARAIGAVRNTSDLFAPNATFPTHTTLVYDADSPNAFAYTSADIAAGSFLLNSIARMTAGAITEMEFRPRQTGTINPLAGLIPDKPSRFPSIFTLGDRGALQMYDRPDLQYAVYRALRDIMDKMQPPEPHDGFAHTQFTIAHKIADNYVRAIERYAPALTQSPINAEIMTMIGPALMEAFGGIAAPDHSAAAENPAPGTATEFLQNLDRLAPQIPFIRRVFDGPSP